MMRRPVNLGIPRRLTRLGMTVPLRNRDRPPSVRIVVKEALILTAALETAEIAPTAAALRRNPAIVRTVGATRAPLDLAVIPFRYRVRGSRIEAVRPNCRHRR